ncbi:MAG: pyridoxal 5'-phosphate synthase glutaminase subunit PdxT [Acidobacteria bacterium]|nr:pyridoxal 5'-phosphate synthase glutaminase subunit PdxT [Acidobacteriota bacterium]
MGATKTFNPLGKPIGILAIQGDFAAHGRILEALKVPFRLVKKAEHLVGLAGLILPGGESTTLIKFFDNEKLWEPLAAFAKDHAVFGTCAGAILMAREVENPAQRCLGLMDMTIRRNAFGRQVYSFIRSARCSNEFNATLGMKAASDVPKIEAVFIRAPLILKAGKAVVPLIKLDDSPVLVRQGNYLAATFHPELSADSATVLFVHGYFCQMCFGALPSPLKGCV